MADLDLTAYDPQTSESPQSSAKVRNAHRAIEAHVNDLPLANLDTTGASSGNVITFSGSAWAPAAPSAGTTLPPGVVVPYAGSSAPTGWLLCDASVVSRVTYAALFAIVGTTYNIGGEAGTDFRLPDLRGRVAVGKGTNAANDTLGENDGVAEASRRGTKHRHTAHGHTLTDILGATRKLWINVVTGENYDLVASTSGAIAGGLTTQANIVVAATDGGSGTATDPLDGGAFIVLNQIIKT